MLDGKSEHKSDCKNMTVDLDESQSSRMTLSDKSRSLRRSSVQKRIETEDRRAKPKEKEKTHKKYKLSKYRRRTENAKERERMRRFNEAFDNLKRLVPKQEVKEQEKDTKVNKELEEKSDNLKHLDLAVDITEVSHQLHQEFAKTTG